MKKLSVPIISTQTPEPSAEDVSLFALLIKLEGLDEQKESIKQYFAEVEATLEAIVKKANVNISDENLYLQIADNEDVFEISKFKGKFSYAPDYDYKRTARDGENSQGKLARKTAVELGFVLPDKSKK